MAFFAYFISHRASGFCRQLIGFEAVGGGELVVVDTPPPLLPVRSGCREYFYALKIKQFLPLLVVVIIDDDDEDADGNRHYDVIGDEDDVDGGGGNDSDDDGGDGTCDGIGATMMIMIKIKQPL